MIRVIIADDHHLVRQGIRALLERVGDIEIIGEADNGQEALELVGQLAPDILIVDISMPRMNGIQTADRVGALRSLTQVIILSMHSDKILVRQAIKAGVKGYLLKNALAEELILAVRAAARGETYLSPAISEIVVRDAVRSTEDTAIDRLSPREREVLQLIAEGLANADIARALTVSLKTVEKHRANLMDKLDIHDVAGLTRIAIKYGLISLDD